MKTELFPFQKRAVADLRLKTALALNNYRTFHIPQVISLQAPTGSGKTIIMASLIEEIYYGSEQFTEQPEAIFVWLSDSPALNEQSRKKIDLKADKIRFSQCVTIEDESFDMEMLEDGHIYFLNTQKLSKAGNLGRHSDTRQYTIWETLANTARDKAGRLYFIIDEAHRGMQGREAGKATSIMQRFLKGSKDHQLPPMPVVIGVSATAARFNKLIGEGTTSSLNKCIVTANEVRASGLLKDRIVITYPDDPEKNNDMAVLHAATDEWKKKCDHWYQYSYEQHYAQVNPVFVIQVLAGSGKRVSDTDLDDVIAKIEERLGTPFREHEVVHTFGSVGTLSINGLSVHHIDPPDIADDRRIRVVLFKENLSTGWDCPRAETMMSFRRAEDATYVAQLLGRMVRTPLQCHILVDDYLNDVRLFLPYFNKATVKEVIDELQNTEGGDIPTVIDDESLERPEYVTLTVHRPNKKVVTPLEGQITITELPGMQPKQPNQPEPALVNVVQPQQEPTPMVPIKPEKPKSVDPVVVTDPGVQTTIPGVNLDREAITRFINQQGLLTYLVRNVKISSYLKSLLDLAGLLTQSNIYAGASREVKDDVTKMIHDHARKLRAAGKYEELEAQVLSFKLSVRVFDVFGEALDNGMVKDVFTASESDLDRQLRAADARLGHYGFPQVYGNKYMDEDDPFAYKIDCILFAAGDDCIEEVRSPVVFGMLKGILCAFCLCFFDDAAVADLQHLAVVDGDVTDAVVEVVAGREDVVLHRKQGLLCHVGGRKLGGGSAAPVFVDLMQGSLRFLGDMERIGGACLNSIEFRLQPVKGVFREYLTAACDLRCGADDQLLVADGDRQVFADVRKSLCAAGDDRFTLCRTVGFRQKNGAVCLDLGHMIKQRLDQPTDTVCAFQVDDVVFSHG